MFSNLTRSLSPSLLRIFPLSTILNCLPLSRPTPPLSLPLHILIIYLTLISFSFPYLPLFLRLFALLFLSSSPFPFTSSVPPPFESPRTLSPLNLVPDRPLFRLVFIPLSATLRELQDSQGVGRYIRHPAASICAGARPVSRLWSGSRRRHRAVWPESRLLQFPVA